MNSDLFWQVFAAAFVLCLAAAPAHSMTGAELVQDGDDFASGYVFGVVEYKVGVLDRNDPKFMSTRDCVLNSKVNAGTLFSMVKSHLHTHPEEMAMPGFVAVLNTLRDMCEPK